MGLLNSAGLLFLLTPRRRWVFFLSSGPYDFMPVATVARALRNLPTAKRKSFLFFLFFHGMKNCILLLLVVLSLSACKSKKQTVDLEGHEAQWKYIPSELHNTYLGMPLEDLKLERTNLRKEPNETFDFRDVYTEYPPKSSGIYHLVYYVDTDHEVEKEKDRNPRLYEYIIEYSSSDKRDEVAREMLGPPNSGEEWMFDSGEGFMIHCWKHQNKLIIAGKIAGTEWE